MATDDLAPVRTVGRYQVVAEIGRGAMGVVYRGFDPVIGRPVALKTIIVGAVAEDAEEFRQRLFREAAAAGALTHPNIVTIHDVVHDGGTTAVAMEFVEGETLADTIARRAPMAWGEALPLFEQICAGLDYAAAKGIVHRDIKPANILLGADGRPRIADFGIARLPSSTFTMSGAVLGSAGYMSPEQVKGAPLDPRSDLFSAATVFYEMLTGRNPFSGTEAANTLYRIVHETAAPVRTLNPAVPASIEAVMTRALAKDPAARYPSGGALIAALKGAAMGTTESSVVGGDRSRAMLAVGVVGLAAAALLTVYVWSRPSVAPSTTTATAPTVPTPAPAAPPAPVTKAPTPALSTSASPPLAAPRAATTERRPAPVTTAPATPPVSVPSTPAPAVTPTVPLPPTSPATMTVSPPPAPAAPAAKTSEAAPPARAAQFGSAVASVKGESYAGVRIFLDDALLPPPYPAQMPKLSEGSHVVRFVWLSGALAGKELTQSFDVKGGGHLLIRAVPESDQVVVQTIR